MDTASNNSECASIMTCKKCEMLYEQICVGQEPGLGERDYDTCVYCGHINGSSTIIMYCNRTLSEELIEHYKVNKK